MKTPPEGLGCWIAFGRMIPGGVDAIIKRCIELGFSWIAPRLGEAANRDGWYTPKLAKEFCEKAHASGLRVYPWIFNRSTAMSSEIALYKAALAEGADGVFLDAEVPYNGKKAEAKIFVALLRKELPDTWIGNAPFSYIEWHLDYPYVEFGQLDAACDQLYHTEFDKNSLEFHAKKVDEHWARFKKKNPTSCARWPIGVTYGSELGKKWGMSKGPPGPIKVEDVKFFLEYYEGLPISFYSLEAMDAPIYEFLKKRAIEHGRPAPPPTPEPTSYRDPIVPVEPQQPIIDNIIPAPPVIATNPIMAVWMFILTLFKAFFSRK